MASSESVLSIDLQSILSNDLQVEAQLTDHIYEFELYITNSYGKIYSISPTAIQNLIINDNIVELGSDGYIVLNFDNQGAEYLDNFVFRNDGEDILRFRLYPKNLTELPLPSLGSLPKKIWEINHIFSIYDIQDVTPKTKGNTDASAVTKLRKIYFKDIRTQLLQSLYTEYSTALSPEAGISSNPEDLSDENRSIKTGTCIYEIIKQSFNNDNILAKTGKDEGSKGEWDDGKTEIFYTSGTAQTSLELLMDVYSRHVCENEKDFSLLRVNRDEGGIGYIALSPLETHFAKAGNGPSNPGELQVEHFFLRNSLKENEVAGRTFRAPILQTGTGYITNDGVRDIKINDYNIIDKYELVDISPSINMKFYNSRSIHSFDFTERQFNIEFTNHSIDTANETINERYINNLYKGRGNNNSLINSSSPIKKANRNIYPQYTPYGDSTDPDTRLPDGLQKLLKNAIFQNTCINFTVPGLTIRQAGTFIGIDRLYGSYDNTADDKMCGQWLVVDVQHIIAAGMYYNTITAVKIHSFSPLTSEERATARAVDRFTSSKKTFADYLPELRVFR